MVAFRPGKKKRVIALTFLPSGHRLFRRIGREKQLRNFYTKTDTCRIVQERGTGEKRDRNGRKMIRTGSGEAYSTFGKRPD